MDLNPDWEDFYSDIFGDTKWKAFGELPINELEIAMRTKYLKSLEEIAEFAIPFTVIFGDRNKTAYDLIHMSRHSKAMIVMKEIMYRSGTAGTYKFWGKSEANRPLFSSEPDLRELENSLSIYYRDKGPINFGQLQIDFYKLPYIEKHYRKVIKEMEKSEQPKVGVIREKSKRNGLVDGDYVIFL